MKVLLIGGCGYIGTRLYKWLTRQLDAFNFPDCMLSQDITAPSFGTYPPLFEVDSVDLEWYGNPGNIQNTKMDYKNLTKEKIAEYEAVILLGAFSSPAVCNNSGIGSVLNNNVRNFIDLLPKLRDGQKFIYASSITVYENNPTTEIEEGTSIISTPTNSYDMSKKECDIVMGNNKHIEFYGLRLATVCGISSNWRNDIMINSMTDNALITNEVKVFNPKNHKPILYSHDLNRAIETILLSSKDRRGFYNLASYNGITEEIAENVADCTHAKLRILSDSEMVSNKLPTTGYDLLVSTKKFEETFNFKFEGSTPRITQEIVDLIDLVTKNKRVDGITYE